MHRFLHCQASWYRQSFVMHVVLGQLLSVCADVIDIAGATQATHAVSAGAIEDAHMRCHPGALGGPSIRRGQRSICRPAQRSPAALRRPRCVWAWYPCSLHALHWQHMFQGPILPGRYICRAPWGCCKVLSTSINKVGACRAHLKAVCSLLGPAARQNTCCQCSDLFGNSKMDHHGPTYLPKCEPP